MSEGPSSKEHDLRGVRREYQGEPLRKQSMHVDPVEQFRQWMQLAQQYQPEDATCMSLATVDGDGLPACRIVLLKHFDARGFCWYSNSGSEKGQQLESNPQAGLLFHWFSLHRQVRVSGRVEPLPRKDAEQYFFSRPAGSQLSAFVSRQSQEVSDRRQLEAAVEQARDDYKDRPLPCPQDWAGYCLRPQSFEFWQGRENRLHDRMQYRLLDGEWRLRRLAP